MTERNAYLISNSELFTAGPVIHFCQIEFHHEVSLFTISQFENVFVKLNETVFPVID